MMNVKVKQAPQTKAVREVKALRTLDRKRTSALNHCHSCGCPGATGSPEKK